MAVETQIFTAYTEGVPTHRASWHNPRERDDNLGNESPRMMSRSYCPPLKSTIVPWLCGSFPERYPVSVESRALRQSLVERIPPATLRCYISLAVGSLKTSRCVVD